MNTITQKFLQELETEQGLTPEAYEYPWQPAAMHYREIICAVAQQISGGHTELTDSQWKKGPKPGKIILALCLDFIDKYDEETYEAIPNSATTYAELAEVLQRHDLIPAELKAQFPEMWVGFNYGTRGGFIIRPEGIEMIDQAKYEANMESDGKIGYKPKEVKGGMDKTQVIADGIYEEVQRIITTK